MSGFLIGIFIILHGLVHLWYFTLSRRLVEFKPEMGWSGRSWILTNPLGDSTTRTLAGALYVLAAIIFAISGIGILIHTEWWRPVLTSAAVFSSAVIILFWDGGLQRIVEKGLLGLFINVMILVALLLLKWPSAAF
jgi:hypothetical protein